MYDTATQCDKLWWKLYVKVVSACNSATRWIDFFLLSFLGYSLTCLTCLTSCLCSLHGSAQLASPDYMKGMERTGCMWIYSKVQRCCIGKGLFSAVCMWYDYFQEVTFQLITLNLRTCTTDHWLCIATSLVSSGLIGGMTGSLPSLADSWSVNIDTYPPTTLYRYTVV